MFYIIYVHTLFSCVLVLTALGVAFDAVVWHQGRKLNLYENNPFVQSSKAGITKSDKNVLEGEAELQWDPAILNTRLCKRAGHGHAINFSIFFIARLLLDNFGRILQMFPSHLKFYRFRTCRRPRQMSRLRVFPAISDRWRQRFLRCQFTWLPRDGALISITQKGNFLNC